MISKLNSNIRINELKNIDRSEIEISNIEFFFQKNNRNISILPFEGGTLGRLFSVSEAKKKKILKSYSPTEEGKSNFSKEISLLIYLYKDILDIEVFDSLLNHSPCDFFIVTHLNYPSLSIIPSVILKLTEECDKKLRNFLDGYLIQEKYNFKYLLQEAIKSSNKLLHLGLIDSAFEKKIKKYFFILEELANYARPVICHGDLSPMNIMTNDKENLIVIDWEDAFWGIEGYDYLYWLTFYSNRKYYSTDVLGKTIWSKEQEIAILILVIILKCELSFRWGNHHKNKLSFNDRILEILYLEKI